MFYRDAEHVLRLRAFEQFSWLIHGFGTRWSPSFGSCRNLATVRQIHSDRCVDAGGRAGVLAEGDALMGNSPGILLGVKTADCIPLLLVDERLRAVAAVHAGWRGTAQQIGAKAIRFLSARYGTQPQDLHAAIGPAIGKCCFEVGPEVASLFGQPANGKVKLDLTEALRRQLLDSGIPAGRIYASGLCTMCGGSEFESYRRDGAAAGRMLSVVGVVERSA
jgi:YfiH family protein